MVRGYRPRLGYTLAQIRTGHSYYRGESYAQVERRLFYEDTHREPTFVDYLKAWWHLREETKLDFESELLKGIGYQASQQ